MYAGRCSIPTEEIKGGGRYGGGSGAIGRSVCFCRRLKFKTFFFFVIGAVISGLDFFFLGFFVVVCLELWTAGRMIECTVTIFMREGETARRVDVL